MPARTGPPAGDGSPAASVRRSRSRAGSVDAALRPRAEGFGVEEGAGGGDSLRHQRDDRPAALSAAGPRRGSARRAGSPRRGAVPSETAASRSSASTPTGPGWRTVDQPGAVNGLRGDGAWRPSVRRGRTSPSARTGRRGGGSGSVAGMVRGAGSDALLMSLRSTVPVGSSATSIRRGNRPNTAFGFRGCFDMRNTLQHNPGPRGTRGNRVHPRIRGFSGVFGARATAGEARALAHSSAMRNRCSLGSDNPRSVDFPRGLIRGEPPPAGCGTYPQARRRRATSRLSFCARPFCARPNRRSSARTPPYFSSADIARRFLVGWASGGVSATGVAAAAVRREEERRAAGRRSRGSHRPVPGAARDSPVRGPLILPAVLVDQRAGRAGAAVASSPAMSPSRVWGRSTP